MSATKQETALDFLNNTCGENNIDFRENTITLSYDFVIDTGTSKVIIKIGQKRWNDSDSRSIVTYLKSKEQQIQKALLTDQSEILPMK